MKTLTLILSQPGLRRTAVGVLATAAALLTPPVNARAGEPSEPPPYTPEGAPAAFSPPLPLPDFFVVAWDRDERNDDDRERDHEREDRDHGDRSHEDRDRDDESREGRDRRDRADGPNEMEMLDRLLAMPPEQLSRIRRAIERIEAMTEEQREELRERLRDFREITPEQRRTMRRKWRELSHEERRAFIKKMREHHWNQVFEEELPQESATSDPSETETAPATPEPPPLPPEPPPQDDAERESR